MEAWYGFWIGKRCAMRPEDSSVYGGAEGEISNVYPGFGANTLFTIRLDKPIKNKHGEIVRQIDAFRSQIYFCRTHCARTYQV